MQPNTQQWMMKLLISTRNNIVFSADIFLTHDEIFLTFNCMMAEMAKRSSGQAIWFWTELGCWWTTAQMLQTGYLVVARRSELKGTIISLHHLQLNYTPSSIYSCSIGHIWEHEICHLGCWAVSEKFLKWRNFCLSVQLFGVVFSCFDGQKFNF